MLDTVDRSVLREICLPFAVGLVLFCAVVAAAQVAKVADAVTGLGITAGDVLQALAYSLPPLLGMLLPVAGLFACLMGVGRLAADRELLGLAALGVSPYRLLRMPALLGGVLAALSCATLLAGEPWGVRGLRSLMARGAQRALAAGVRAGEFQEWVPGVMFYAAASGPAGLQDVVLADLRDAALPLTISARAAAVRPSQRPQDVVFELREGTLLLAEAAAPTAAGAEAASSVAAGAEAASSVDAGAEAASSVAAGAEAASSVDAGAEARSPASTGDGSRVVDFARGLFRLDVGRLVGNKAHNLTAMQELTPAQLWAAGHDAAAAPSWRAWATVALHRKLAVPAAALVFALLAVPLAMGGRGAARARGFLICLALVAAYYYVGRAAELAARGGRFPPVLAAWLPDLLALSALGLMLPGMRRGRT